MADERGDDRRIRDRWNKFVSGPQQDKPWWRSLLDIITAPFRWFLHYAGGIFGIIVMLVLLVGAVIFAYNYATSGVLQLQTTQLVDTLSKTPILKPILDTLKIIKDPSITVRQYSWQAEVDENSQNQELGLIFQKFTSLKKTYLPNEPLSFVASIKIASLKDDSKVTFSCEDTTSKINGNIEPKEPVVLPKDSIQVFSVRCDIPTETIKLGEKKIKAETVVLKAVYDFKTNAYIEAYTMSKQLLTEKQNNLENVFENEENSRLNKATGEVRSQYTAGPIKILINSEYSQPFTEAGPFTNDPYYSLGIAIEKASSFYQGRLNKINNVYLYLPKNFELKEDNLFEFSNEEDEIFNKYKLKEETINKLNSVCNGPNSLNLECQTYWERGFIIALTSFKVNSLNKPELDKNYIRAEVEYDFQAETSQVVTIAESFAVS